MSSEGWLRIESLFHAALEQDTAHRAAFVAEACQGDEELRGRVEILLRAEAADVGELDRPAWDGASGEVDDSTRSVLAPATQLGPYRIDALIGTGGMGRVYRALDSRLGRAVAIKIAARQFSDRFEREARAIGALNHPHICTLHDVGPNYLVMELVEGETLATVLRKGPLPPELAIRYGAQIADALSAAHARGVIHRDLKPGNIMVARNGVKVLDFGLAKLALTATAAEQSAMRTGSETIVGTPAYMAPEQLDGKECDARTDIFGLGLVLYEMTVGRRAFTGDSRVKLIAEVMRCEPDLSKVHASAPRSPDAALPVERSGVPLAGGV